MLNYFDEMQELKASWRALQIWQILISCAYNRQIIRYKDLAEIIGFAGAGVFSQLLGRVLYYCQDEGLPPLTSLVVRDDGGLPGDGFGLGEYETIDAARNDVFKTEWYKIVPPSAKEFQDAWNNNYE